MTTLQLKEITPFCLATRKIIAIFYTSIQGEEMNEGEKKVVSKMIAVYCRSRHGAGKGLCDECTLCVRMRCDDWNSVLLATINLPVEYAPSIVTRTICD